MSRQRWVNHGYLDRFLRQALSSKTPATDRSISRVVDGAGRLTLVEDAEDLIAFRSRAREPNFDFDNVVRSLRRRGKV